MSINGFGKKIAAYQDELLTRQDAFTDDIGDVRKRLFSSKVETVSNMQYRGLLIGFGVVAIAACALIAVLGFGGPEPGASVTPLTGDSLQGQWLFASTGDESVAFVDNSKVVLKKGSTARILSEEGHGVHFLLEQGVAHVNVIHYDDTNWVMDVGPYKVNVVGTTFTLSWVPQTQVFSLTLDEGAVEVFGPMVEDGRRISHKETFTASVLKGTVEIRSAEPVKLALDKEDVDEKAPLGAPVAATSTVTKRHSSAPHQGKNRKDFAQRPQASNKKMVSWQEMNRQGKFSDVVKNAKTQGIGGVLASKPVSELMALGDAARLVKEWQLANETYMALRKRAPGSKNASTAAFSIGKIAFDTHKHYGVAAQWLETYLTEDPSGRLAREALGRLMEAHQKMGNLSGAQSAAHQYMQKYPAGPHVDVAVDILK